MREVRLGLTTDARTLQRLPKIVVNQSTYGEHCLTAQEAVKMGLVSRVVSSRTETLRVVWDISCLDIPTESCSSASFQKGLALRVWINSDHLTVVAVFNEWQPIRARAVNQVALQFIRDNLSSKFYIRDCTALTPYSLLLFGGALEIFHSDEVIAVDRWLKFKIMRKLSVLMAWVGERKGSKSRSGSPWKRAPKRRPRSWTQ